MEEREGAFGGERERGYGLMFWEDESFRPVIPKVRGKSAQLRLASTGAPVVQYSSEREGKFTQQSGSGYGGTPA